MPDMLPALDEVTPESFRFEGRTVRAYFDGDEALLAATDVASILNYRDAADLTRLLDADEVHPHVIRTNAGCRSLSFITEAGFYKAVLKRRTGAIDNPQAAEFVKRFQRWVTHDVLPTIRQHGAYVTEQTTEAWLANPDRMIEALTALKAERARRHQLEARTAIDAPKARTFDAFMAADGTFGFRQCVKLWQNAGCTLNESQIKARLINHKRVFRLNGRLTPHAEWVRKGHMTTITRHPRGDVETTVVEPELRFRPAGLLSCGQLLGCNVGQLDQETESPATVTRAVR